MAHADAWEEAPVVVEPTWLRILTTGSKTLNLAAAVIAAGILLAMVGLVMSEIVLRSFFAKSTFMTDILVAYGVAASTFLGLAWTMEKNGMIRVLMVYQWTGPKGRWWFEFIGQVSTIAILSILAWYMWHGLARNFVRNTMSQHTFPIPLWIPDAIFFTGLSLLLFHLLLRLVRLFMFGVPNEREVVI